MDNINETQERTPETKEKGRMPEEPVGYSYELVMREYPPMTDEEEKKYGRMLKGTPEEREEAIDMLVKKNLRLVYKMARTFSASLPPGMYEDIIQEGVLGLKRGAEKYDVDMGFRFSTYASNWIFQAVTRYIGLNRSIVKLPTNLDQVWLKMRKIQNEAGKDNKTVSDEEMIKELGISESQYALIKDANLPGVSLNQYADSSADDPTEIGDLILRTDVTPESEMIDEERSELLKRLMRTYLNERDEDIITKRFGLDGTEPMTLDEIASEYHVTRERIRQLQDKALRKLSAPGIKAFLKELM